MVEKIIDGVIYLLDEETLTAEVIGGDGCKGDIEILKTVVLNDVSYRVTTIGPEAFSCCNSLTDITIPDTVTSIGRGALYCPFKKKPIQEIKIDKLTYRLLMHNHLAMVVDYSGDSQTIDIPSKITYEGVNYRVITIGKEAFFLGSSLTNITIPDSVTSIESGAFCRCTSLITITIPDSVTSIGESAFKDCESLTSIVLPNSVKSIKEWTFAGCKSFTSIAIPDSVTSIRENAFYGCSKLTSITIPDTLMSIELGAFWDCESLTFINGVEYRLYEENLTAEVVDFENDGCKGEIKILETIELSGVSYRVTSIGNCAFRNCESLTSITMSDNVTTIGEGAFYECKSLTTVIISNNVTTIEMGAFMSCTSLNDITIPNSVTSIGKGAFAGCKSLNSIKFQGTIMRWNEIEFGRGWKSKVPATVVHCTDSDMEI